MKIINHSLKLFNLIDFKIQVEAKIIKRKTKR